MHLIHAAAVGQQTNNGTDWKLLTSIPATVLALVGLAAYFVGIRKPLVIRYARYWTEAGKLRFECVIRNRSLLWDRTPSGLTFAEEMPAESSPRLKRRRHRVVAITASGDDVAPNVRRELQISKQDAPTVTGVLDVPADVSPLSGRLCVRVDAGHQHSAYFPLLHLVDPEPLYDAGADMLALLEERLPDLLDYLKAIVAADAVHRHEIRLLLQQRVLTHAAEGGRRVALYYASNGSRSGSGPLRAEWKCPGWGAVRPPKIDASTPRGRAVLGLLDTGTVRICTSRTELDAKPDYQATAREPQRYPAFAVIPMRASDDPDLATEDPPGPIGVLEVEAPDEMSEIEVTALVAMADVLACAKLLDTQAPAESGDGHAR
jgi:hypothetical protein